MYCKYCGNSIEDNSKFCPNCGAHVEAEQTQQSSSEPTSYSAPDYSNAQYANYQPNYPQNGKQPGEGFAIAGLVLGIVSLFCFGFICGVLGIIFGAVAKSKGYKGGMATAGIVLGIIGAVGHVFVLMI